MSPRPPRNKRKAKGRMIRVTISDSTRFAQLSPNSMILFTLLIPHYDDYGKMQGDPYFIKGQVVPFIEFFDLSTIEASLREIALKTAVKWFAWRGRHYLQALHFEQHQDLRADRRRLDNLPGFDECKDLPANAWLVQTEVFRPEADPEDCRQSAGNPPQLAGKVRETPSSSTSPSPSTSELPINISTTTTRAREKEQSQVVASYPLTAAGLAGIIPEIDDEAVAALVIACRFQQSSASDAEIAYVLERKFQRAKQLKTRNLAGYLLVAVPKCFVGEGYKNLQRSLAASQAREGLVTTRKGYIGCAVDELERFLKGEAPISVVETWLPYLEAQLADFDAIPAADRQNYRDLCIKARRQLPAKAFIIEKSRAARGP